MPPERSGWASRALRAIGRGSSRILPVSVDVDLSFVPVAASGLVPVAVGDELVLLDGWNVATRLDATGSLMWSSLDGEADLGTIAADLASAVGADEQRVFADLVLFVGDLGQRGLVANLTDASGDLDLDLQLEVVPPHVLGDVIDDLELRTLDGKARRSHQITEAGAVLLVNWNPHCGYCARIADELVGLRSELEANGCGLAFVATGGAEANRAVAADAGLDASDVNLLGAGQDLFRGAGTPSAYHLDRSGRITAPPAYGADLVLALARELAGSDGAADEVTHGATVRYLLDRDGACGPTPEGGLVPVWSGTRVYRVGEHHVGIRHDSSETAAVLDRLFLGRRVDDPRAGHSFSVALDRASTGGRHGGARPLNLLIQDGQPAVRTRSPARVVRALLSRLADGTTPFDPACGRVQVDAIAVLHGRGAALLPWWLHGFAPRLQGLLARSGLAMVDVRYPQIDLATAELVISEASVDHDQVMLAAFGEHDGSPAERPPAHPGRYPLTTWCIGVPGAPGATLFTPAEAAAAALSTVRHTEDAPERVRSLGRLFHRVDGVGLWYDSEAGAIAAVVEALRFGETG